MKRFLLVVVGLFLGLLIVEILLVVFREPRFYKIHSHPPQFAFLESDDNKNVVYFNAPSQVIRFIYDGNPRGYFGKHGEVDHITNSMGFRGTEFSLVKKPNTFRIAFLGDSFTFGEGVWFKDTYPEKLALLLSNRYRSSGLKFESYNFGVGGYNTSDELFLLRNIVLRYHPDMVILGYTLGDAEPALFNKDPITGNIYRNPVEQSLGEGVSDSEPPDKFLYKPRISKLVWKYFYKKGLNAKTVSYYNSLYDNEKKGWQDTEKALADIIMLCRDKNIPCYIVCFPVLYNLDDRYPFHSIRSKVEEVVKKNRGAFIDIFPYLKNRDAAELWVHPTDQHPNEAVHKVVSEAILKKMMQDKTILQGLKN